MKFKIFYSIYLIICLLYPGIMVLGPISIRHILTIIMLFLCFLEKRNNIDRFLFFYFIFLFFYALAESITGYLAEFLINFLGSILASIVLYMGAKIVVSKYNGAGLIITIVTIVALLDSLVAIGQFTQIPVLARISDVLGVSIQDEEFYDSQLDTNFIGKYVGGFMGVVASGYFLSASLVLSLYNPKNTPSMFNWGVFFIIFLALFFVQERSGFAAGVIGILIYFILYASKNRRFLMISIFVIIGLILGGLELLSNALSFEEMRYGMALLEGTGREGIMQKAWNWFLQNPLGGFSYYLECGGEYPHNLFMNALLQGGLFGGILVLSISITQLFIIFKVLWDVFKGGKQYSVSLLLACIAYFVYTLNSFFHNPSLSSGVAMFFILWAIARASLEKEGYFQKR